MSIVLCKIAKWSDGSIRRALFLGHPDKGTTFDETIKDNDSYYPNEVSELTATEWAEIPDEKKEYRAKNSGWASMR